MIIRSASEMLAYGAKLATRLKPPIAVELIGDVGAGKTTLVQGIAKALGVREAVTSPSFVINKKYHGADNLLISHYDFYRLSDPGLMAAELAESIHDPRTITIVEWSDTVAHILPIKRLIVKILYNDDGTRSVETMS